MLFSLTGASPRAVSVGNRSPSKSLIGGALTTAFINMELIALSDCGNRCCSKMKIINLYLDLGVQ